MDKYLPAPKKNVVPAALVDSLLVCSFLMLLTLSCLYVGTMTLSAGFMVVGLLNYLIAAVLLYRYGGYFIGVPSAVFLLSRIRARRYGRAELNYRRVLKLWKALPVAKDMQFTLAYSNLGVTQAMQGEFDAAELSYREAARLMQGQKRYQKHYLKAVILNNLASVLIHQGEYEEAERLSLEALQIYQGGADNSKSGAMLPLLCLSLICLRTGRLGESERRVREAFVHYAADKTPRMIIRDAVEQSRLSLELISIILQLKIDEVATAREKTQDFISRMQQDDRFLSPFAISLLNDLSSDLYLIEENELAERICEIAYGIARDYPHHPDSVKLLDEYTKLLTATGRENEVSDLKRWLRPINAPRAITMQNK